ncbi:MAG: ethylbenzene dehydrogenase-related protein [Nitrospinaceae bacterium]
MLKTLSILLRPGALGAAILTVGALLGLAACSPSGAEVEACLEEGSCIAALEVRDIPGNLPLNPDDPFWDSPRGPDTITVELGPQMITNPKWPDPAIKKVTLGAVRNKGGIAILMEWEDPTVDNRYGPSDYYTDQAALMFPLVARKDAPSITMGNENQTVNIWQWKAIWEKEGRSGRNKRLRERGNFLQDRVSPVEDLNAEGFSTLTIQEQQDVKGRGLWRDKRWRVIFKRSLTDADSLDVQFRHSMQMAVAVWDGANRERNGQKGIAGWILLRFG